MGVQALQQTLDAPFRVQDSDKTMFFQHCSQVQEIAQNAAAVHETLAALHAKILTCAGDRVCAHGQPAVTKEASGEATLIDPLIVPELGLDKLHSRRFIESDVPLDAEMMTSLFRQQTHHEVLGIDQSYAPLVESTEGDGGIASNEFLLSIASFDRTSTQESIANL